MEFVIKLLSTASFFENFQVEKGIKKAKTLETSSLLYFKQLSGGVRRDGYDAITA